MDSFSLHAGQEYNTQCWSTSSTVIVNDMDRAITTCVLSLSGACLFLFSYVPSYGQISSRASAGHTQAVGDDKDPIAVVELGAAMSWNLTGGAATFAPNLAAEVTPIEHWLELEAGVSPFYTRKSTEWDTDLLFKKPWTISRKAEFMLGVGPEWVHLNQVGKVTNSIAGELAGDFMFWPASKHRFGWFVEPAYDYSFARGHQQSIGISGGLLIGIP
jgi:hypothetical protein